MLGLLRVDILNFKVSYELDLKEVIKQLCVYAAKNGDASWIDFDEQSIFPSRINIDFGLSNMGIGPTEIVKNMYDINTNFWRICDEGIIVYAIPGFAKFNINDFLLHMVEKDITNILIKNKLIKCLLQLANNNISKNTIETINLKIQKLYNYIKKDENKNITWNDFKNEIDLSFERSIENDLLSTKSLLLVDNGNERFSLLVGDKNLIGCHAASYGIGNVFGNFSIAYKINNNIAYKIANIRGITLHG